MKKTGFFTLFFIFLCIGVWAGDYTWTGNFDDDWNNPLNWYDDDNSPSNDYPGNAPGDTVIINNGVAVTLTDDVGNTLDSLEIEGTDLDLSTFSLAVDTLSLTNGADLTGDLTANNVTIDDFSVLDGTISFFSGDGIFTIDASNVKAVITGNNIVCGDLNIGTRELDVTQGGGTGSVGLNSTVTAGDINLIVNGTGQVDINSNWPFSKVTFNTDVSLSSDLSTDTLDTISNDLIIGSNALSVTGTFTQSAGNIELSGGSIEAGSITQTGGTIDITTATAGTLKSSSTVTQSGGTITGSKLILEAAGAIALTETNGITVLQITEAGGSVQFSNNTALEIAGINGVGNNNVTITVTGVGNNITQSAIIETSGKLSLSANGAITLTEANKVAKLEITGAGGAVQFTNSVALDVTGINGVGNNNVTITVTTGGLSVDVINSGGDITLESNADITIGIGGINVTGAVKLQAGGNITVSGKITAYQLIAKAPNNTVSINAVEIDSSNTGNERESAAIYIFADTFAVTTTTANTIIPGGTGGQLCLELDNRWTDTNSVIDGYEDMSGMSNIRWHQHISGIIIKGEIFYSFTEDSDGNGRLDRIRVQSNYAIIGDFSDFDVTVEGYVIDRTKGTNGFQRISDIPGKTPFDNDSFYIYLKENPEIDGGNTPFWSVIRNTSLLSVTGSKLGDPAIDKNIKPIDTIPPRIAYTLTIPGYPQTYVQMSEPVVSVSVSGVVSASFDGFTDVNAQSAILANLGYLFDYSNSSNSYGVDDLASLPEIYQDTTTTWINGYFQIENITDKEPKPNWSLINPACLPKYPLNWGYTEYAKVIDDSSDAQKADGSTIPFSDVFTPPNKLLTVDMMTKLADGAGSTVTPNSSNIVIRRVTDVMISTAPTTANSSGSVDDNYFVWPVWAKPSTVNTGTIWQFDGTAYLERDVIEKNNGIELQARIKNSLTGNLEFLWTTVNIPADRRNPKEATESKKVGGLWLPNVSGNHRLYYYVLPSDISGSKSAASSSALFNFDITADTIINGGTKFEFIFRFANSDMFAARLDAAPGIIPSNWYALVRPFSFDLQSFRQQRGGVTIMNNVINSDKRETAYIRYNLTRSGSVTIQIYTLDGTLVKSIKRNEKCDAGTYVDTWDGSNNGGRAVARGMYFVRVVGPDIDEIRKIMVVK